MIEPHRQEMKTRIEWITVDKNETFCQYILGECEPHQEWPWLCYVRQISPPPSHQSGSAPMQRAQPSAAALGGKTFFLASKLTGKLTRMSPSPLGASSSYGLLGHLRNGTNFAQGLLTHGSAPCQGTWWSHYLSLTRRWKLSISHA